MRAVRWVAGFVGSVLVDVGFWLFRWGNPECPHPDDATFEVTIYADTGPVVDAFLALQDDAWLASQGIDPEGTS